MKTYLVSNNKHKAFAKIFTIWNALHQSNKCIYPLPFHLITQKHIINSCTNNAPEREEREVPHVQHQQQLLQHIEDVKLELIQLLLYQYGVHC